MKKIIPITDLQRQAGQIVGGVVSSDEPVIITQRGRPAAVLLSARRSSQLEEDLSSTLLPGWSTFSNYSTAASVLPPSPSLDSDRA
jgi:prevent-host-death family protein